MAPRVSIRATVYEKCKKRIESKNELQKSLSPMNPDNFEIRLSAQQNMVSPNECSNRFELCQQNIKSYKEKDNFKLDLQSASMSNKSDFCGVNTNSVVIKVEDQGTEKHLRLNHQMSQKEIFVCSICYSSFENETVFTQHFRKFHEKKRGRKATPMECNVCQLKFTCKVDFNIHNNRTHTRKTKVFLNKPNKCSNRFEKYQQYIESYKVKDSVEVELQSASTSKFCRENTSTVLEKIKDQGADKHLKISSQMLQKKSYACSICYSSFENITILIQHEIDIHGTKPGRKAIPMECNVCHMKFTCKGDYKIHYRIHSSKKHVCPYCKKKYNLKFTHRCKNDSRNKPKKNVWDACKEVLTEKPTQQISSTNSESVPKLPISNKFLYVLEKSKSFNPYLITKYRPLLVKNKNRSKINSVSCAKKSLDKFKNSDDQRSDNCMDFKGKATDLVKTEDTKLFCNLCNIFFEEIEKYEAHHAFHLDEELCQIREDEEELHVCDVCGWCFTEMKPFQAHKLTHMD